MYINSRVILQDIQGGFMCEDGIFLGGSMEDCQDLGLDLGITWNPKGLDVKQPRAFSSSRQMRMAARVAPVDAKSAPSAKHTASRTSWLYTRKESQDVPVNFS
jgi:hypothetical protein